MSADQKNTIDEMMRDASALEASPAKVMLLEAALELADTLGDVGRGCRVREQLIEACMVEGAPERALVHFSWCLAQADRRPEFSQEELLTKYKWIVGVLPDFPQISRAQMDETLVEMAGRFQRAGASLRPVYKLERDNAMEMGDMKAAQAAHQQMTREWHDRLSDCVACEMDMDVEYLLFRGQDERALEQAKPILKGTLFCEVVPHRTLARVLLPLVRLGRVEEAMPLHQRGYRLIAGNPGFLKPMSNHVSFLVLTENLRRAARLLEKHLAWALDAKAPARRFAFFLAIDFFLERVLETGIQRLRARLPETFPAYEESGAYDPAKLKAWFAGQLQELAAQFDARNGNDYFSRRIRDGEKLKAFIKPCPWPKK